MYADPVLVPPTSSSGVPTMTKLSVTATASPKKSFVDPSDAVIFVSTSCAEEREDRRVSRAREVLGIMALPEVVEGMWVS